MKLSALLNPRLVICGLAAQSKDEALSGMAKALTRVEPGLTEAELLAALGEREKQGPFSMGKGIAFPHARTEKVRDFTIVLATVPAGLDFKAPDGVRVRVLILFVIPKKHSNLYLQTLAAFLNFFTVESNFQRVMEAKTGDEVIASVDALGGKARDASGPGPAGPVPSVTAASPLSRAIELFAASKAEALPIVDGEGNLVGELTAASVLQFGVREHLLTLATPATLSDVGSIERAIRLRADGSLESLGLVHANGCPTVQEDETPLDLAVRLGGGRPAYVLKGRKLVGMLTPAELLRRLSGR